MNLAVKKHLDFCYVWLFFYFSIVSLISRRAKAIGDLITEMRTLDDWPFTLIEDQGFSGLINYLESRLTLPLLFWCAMLSVKRSANAFTRWLRKKLIVSVAVIDIRTCDVNPMIRVCFTYRNTILHKTSFGTITGPIDMLLKNKLSKNLGHAFFNSAQIPPMKIRWTLFCFVLPC